MDILSMKNTNEVLHFKMSFVQLKELKNNIIIPHKLEGSQAYGLHLYPSTQQMRQEDYSDLKTTWAARQVQGQPGKKSNMNK